MIKTLLLIFEPRATWERIVRAHRSLTFILMAHLLPLLALTSAWEAYGLAHWGKPQGTVARLKVFPAGEAVIFEAAQTMLSLAVVLICTWLVKALGETFHGRHTYPQTFTAVAYGLGPVFLLRVLDAFPGISPWVGWSIGIILSIAVLYQGLPQVMQPDPPHAFGLYVMTSVLLALISGLARFLTAWYLQGRFVRPEALVSG